MSYADNKQQLMEDIANDPARFLIEQFQEGSVFYGEEWGLDVYDLEDLPVIMRLENADNIYLTVTSWWLGDPYYKKLEYQAHTREDGGWLPLPWVRSCVTHEECQLFRGKWWELELAAVGIAADEWREITTDILRHNPSAVYAWFFPCGLKLAMQRDGMFMHVNNQDRSKEA